MNSCDCTGTCEHYADMFDCGYCLVALAAKRKNSGPAELPRPERIDFNSNIPPKYLIPSEDFMFPNNNQYVIIAEATVEVTLTVLQAVARGIDLRYKADKFNRSKSYAVSKIVDFFVKDRVWNVICRKAVNYLLPDADTNTVVKSGTYTIIVALYQYNDGILVLKRVSGPKGSYYTSGWAVRGLKDGQTISDYLFLDHRIRLV